MLKQYKLRNYNFRLVFYVVLLTVIGILVIGSARESVQDKQILGLFLGFIIMVIVSMLDYSVILRFSWLFYFLNIGLLILVKFMGDNTNGSTRWIEIAGIRFQPSELSKIVIILFFAYFFMKSQEQLNTVKILAASFLLAGIPLFLIKEQPDLSTTIVTALLFASLLFSLFVGSNYRLAGFLTVISYGLSALLAMGLTEVKREKEKASGTDSLLLPLKQIFKNKNILLFLIGIALLNETHQTVTVFLSQLQYERCGLTISAMGYIYILVTVAGLCGAWSFGLTKKLGDFRLTVFLYAVAAISCILLAVTDSPWLTVIGILTLRIAFSLFQPLQTELQNRQIHAENRATALSVNAVIIDSVGAGTNIAFGTLAEKSLFTTFLFGAGLCMLGSMFVLRQIKKI